MDGGVTDDPWYVDFAHSRYYVRDTGTRVEFYVAAKEPSRGAGSYALTVAASSSCHTEGRQGLRRETRGDAMASVKRKATVAAVGALVASALLGLCVAHGQISSAVIADFQKSMSPEVRGPRSGRGGEGHAALRLANRLGPRSPHGGGGVVVVTEEGGPDVRPVAPVVVAVLTSAGCARPAAPQNEWDEPCTSERSFESWVRRSPAPETVGIPFHPALIELSVRGSTPYAAHHSGWHHTPTGLLVHEEWRVLHCRAPNPVAQGVELRD